MSIDYSDDYIKLHMYEGKIGIEQESIRVDKNGNIAKSPHPFGNDKHISRDFAECQMEFITDVFEGAKEAYEALKAIRERAKAVLHENDEYIWRFSNPPVLIEEEIVEAMYCGDEASRLEYRKYLAKKYGKKKMMYSGIHFNYSMPSDVISYSFKKSAMADIKEFTDKEYLSLAANMMRQAWLPVLLMAASPVCDKSFFAKEKGTMFSGRASMRCSDLGYWNDFVPVLDYTSVGGYIESIDKYIRSGQLYSQAELYYPVRLKPVGENTFENMRRFGISHIEYRPLDLVPYSDVGIIEEDLIFLHLWSIYLGGFNNNGFGEREQFEAIERVKRAALFDINKELSNEGVEIILDMKKLFGEKYSNVLDFEIDKLKNPKNRYAYKIYGQFKEDYIKRGMLLAKGGAGQ